jgi:hypothetical protein
MAYLRASSPEEGQKQALIPEPQKAQARNIVCEKIGASEKTAEQSACCVRTMDAGCVTPSCIRLSVWNHQCATALFPIPSVPWAEKGGAARPPHIRDDG